MKFFTMCWGGNVRSAGLSYVLKNHGQQSLAAGHGTASPETIRMLCEWADYIMPMQTVMTQYIPQEFHAKMRIIDVGPDIWGTPMHPTLQEFFERIVKEWAARDWKI